VNEDEPKIELELEVAKRIWERARGQFGDNDEDYLAVSKLWRAIVRVENEIAGANSPYYQHPDDPSYIDGDNPICPG
jgi:hypothetical protein